MINLFRFLIINNSIQVSKHESYKVKSLHGGSSIQGIDCLFYFIYLIFYYTYFSIINKVHAEIRIGEEVRVSGDAPALGCGDPNLAVPMFTSPHEYPWWRAKEGIKDILS